VRDLSAVSGDAPGTEDPLLGAVAPETLVDPVHEEIRDIDPGQVTGTKGLAAPSSISLEGRAKGSVLGGLVGMSDQARDRIETVVIDCHWPYRDAIEEVLPRVRIVADKFHVIRAVDAAGQSGEGSSRSPHPGGRPGWWPRPAEQPSLRPRGVAQPLDVHEAGVPAQP
jgi:hypothetical protein